MATVTMQDGTPIHYLDQGEGPVLVLLHGLMMTADGFWTRNLDALAGRCRVIAVDHRSHGLSGKPLGPHTIEQCARDLRELLDQLALEEVTLAGVAFGAMVMLEYRRLFGNHRLARLAIIEAQVRLTNAPGWEHPTFGDFPAEAADGFVAACRASREPLVGFLGGAFGSAPAADEMARMQEQAWLTPTAAAIEYVQDMVRADYRADLAAIDLPTLLVYGRENNVPIPSELGEWIQSQIAGARLERFEDAGHSPFYERPERFNRVLAAFAAGQG
jgi:pimeloyl-ACP methyl ester carboxylesterase